MRIEGDKWYSPSEAAAAVGANVETIRRWIRQGKLPAQRRLIQRTYRIKGADLLARMTELERD